MQGEFNVVISTGSPFVYEKQVKRKKKSLMKQWVSSPPAFPFKIPFFFCLIYKSRNCTGIYKLKNGCSCAPQVLVWAWRVQRLCTCILITLILWPAENMSKFTCCFLHTTILHLANFFPSLVFFYQHLGRFLWIFSVTLLYLQLWIMKKKLEILPGNSFDNLHWEG